MHHSLAPHARDMTQRRYRYRGRVNLIEQRKNRYKLPVRAKSEHPFLVLKRLCMSILSKHFDLL